jgi:MoaA/NifB/PqqE/SkfB family radical SAM enzyme
MCAHPGHKKNNSIKFGDMDWDTFLKTKYLWDYADEIILGGNGEALMSPLFIDMAKSIKNKGCFVHTFSNGLLLNKEISFELVKMKFDSLHISIGGATKQTYEKIRGVNALESVKTNLQNLINIKKALKSDKPKLFFNIALMRSMLNELEDIVKLAADFEVESIAFFHVWIFYDHLRDESLWLCQDEAIKQLNSAKKTAEKFGINLSVPTFVPSIGFCDQPFSSIFIQQTGDIALCSGLRFTFGNINDVPIQKIWNSESWMDLRNRIHTKGYEFVCPGCPEWNRNNKELLLNVPQILDN